MVFTSVLLLVVKPLILFVLPGAHGTIGQFIKYYEGLKYDRQTLQQHHQRVKREVVSHKQQLHLNFSAFQR